MSCRSTRRSPTLPRGLRRDVLVRRPRCRATSSPAPTSASARAGPATPPLVCPRPRARLRRHRRAAGLRRSGRLFVVDDPRGARRGPAGGGRAHPRPLAPDRGPGPARRQTRARPRLPDREPRARRSASAALRRLRRARRRARRSAPGRYQGVAPSGCARPSARTRPNLEVYLLDFAGDLYGAALSVALVAFQRPELRFDAVHALVVQMEADAEEARARLARRPA